MTQTVGQAIAVAFAQAHAKGIALLGRTKSTLDDTAAEVQQASNGKTDVLVLIADITSQSDVQAAMNSTIQHFGSVPDVLVNNAGGLAGIGSLTDVDIDDFMSAFEINVRGPLTVLQTYLRANQKHSPDTPRTVINLPSGAAHLPYAPSAAAYGCSKLANSKITEYVHHENPAWSVFNMQPGVVATDLARQAGRKAPDSPSLPAGFAVWLAASPEARKLNGKFIWVRERYSRQQDPENLLTLLPTLQANWDINELLKRAEEINQRDLLTLTLKGWAEDCNAEELKRRATSVHRDADRKE